MTDNETIKALECCRLGKCAGEDCPLYAEETEACITLLAENALDLINRQKAEIERLKEQVNLWQEEASSVGCENEWLKQIQSDNEKAFNKMTELYNKAFNRCKTARAEAIKEFAERLKVDAYTNNYCEKIVLEADIDNLVKEMVGEG